MRGIYWFILSVHATYPTAGSAFALHKVLARSSDVLDVIEEIKKLKKITDKQVKDAQKLNFEKKGGFEKKIFLFWSSDTGYKSNERKYKK